MFCSERDKLHRRVLLPQQLRQPVGGQEHRGGVIAGVNADELPAVVLVQQDRHPMRRVIQRAKGCHGAGRQPQQRPQLLRSGKGKRPVPQTGFQRL